MSGPSKQDGDFWAIVQTIANKEFYALENLRRQGFDVWCPKVLRNIRHARKSSWQKRPFFAGYLFVHLKEHSWRAINGTHGVSRIITSGSKPARLPDGWVDDFIAHSDDDGVVNFRQELAAGDEVRVVSGSFDDWIGKVVCLPDADRVTLLFDLITRSIPVTLPRGSVVKAV